MVLLGFFSIIYLILVRKKINWLAYNLSTWTFCYWAWSEFVAYPVWEFDPTQVTGLRVLGMAFEDFLFAPIMSTYFFALFRWLYNKLDPSDQSSELSKIITFIALGLITINFYNFGGRFAHYECLRMAIGLWLIKYSWHIFNVKMFWKLFVLAIIPTELWEIWAGNTTPQQWWYRHIITLEHSPLLSDWGWFKIGKAWFNLEFFPFYYISAIVFIYGVLNGLFYKLQEIRNVRTRIKC